MNKVYPTMWARLMANSRPTEKGCWEWTGPVGTGRGKYPQLSCRVDGKHKTLRAHRVIAEIVLGRKLTDDETIEHECCNTLCICPHDLLIATRRDNTREARERAAGRPTQWLRDRMTPVVPRDDDNWRGRFWHYAEPIPF